MTTAIRLSVASAALLFPFLAFAHATVVPTQTAPSKYENYSLSVPTERDVPTTGIRLLVPENVNRVTPVVKPGWKIAIKKEGDVVKEIEWTGGSIPAGQKDIFEFTARASTSSPEIIWKVYQTYRGGEVVGWDRDPKALAEGETKVANPFSITEVIEPKAEKEDKLPLLLSLGSLIISIGAMFFATRRA